MVNNTWEYVVIEDSGGGLSLFVFSVTREVGGVQYAHDGYEYHPSQLIDDLTALDNGSNVTEWDGCMDDPQGAYDHHTEHGYAPDGSGGSSVVAEGRNGTHRLYPERMGYAARAAFNPSDAVTR